MFVLQAQAEKGDDEREETKRFGMKVGKADFLAAAMAMPDDQFAGALETLEKAFKKQGISKFMSTLTPGAQNAINAGSFVWGYENAARYVQNAMKLDEVKNAANEAERSKAVIESVQHQASGETKTKSATTFAWGYYNEDMKQAQAQSGVSETYTEKEKERHEQQQSGVLMPLTAAEAVSMGILHGSPSPQLLYCAAAGEAVQGALEKEEEGKRRERLERLEGGRAGEPKIIALMPEEARMRAVQETQREAERRREALVKEHEEIEMQLEAALVKIGSFKRDGQANAKKIAAMLPSELAKAILAGKGRYAKRKALKKQIEGWLAFSKGGRMSVASLPLGKLLKLASLSSLLK